MAGFNKVLSKKNKRKTFFLNFIEITFRRAEDGSHEAGKLQSLFSKKVTEDAVFCTVFCTSGCSDMWIISLETFGGFFEVVLGVFVHLFQ